MSLFAPVKNLNPAPWCLYCEEKMDYILSVYRLEFLADHLMISHNVPEVSAEKIAKTFYDHAARGAVLA